jgi:4-amino-4-deoxy-L-arabinose transferase-like glycosyltransferase
MRIPLPAQTAWLLVISAIILFGCWLRLPAAEDRALSGFDESIYERYTHGLNKVGIIGIDALIQEYVDTQPQARQAFLPPTRVLFLALTSTVSRTCGLPPREAVRAVSTFAACLALVITAIFVWRAVGPEWSAAVTALMSCAPTQIHMAHRALIDGFFGLLALIAIWALWECLRKPRHPGWLALYGAAIAAMVLTKENAFFVYVAICGILLVNHFFPMGERGLPLYAVTVIAPVVGALLLVSAAGSATTLIEAFRANVEKSQVLPYAIATGDGPWHRYLLDLVTISPVVTVFAICALAHWRREDRLKLYLVLFIAFTYAVMSQVKYGLNIRYGNMWDMPLRWLVVAQLVFFTRSWRMDIRRYALPGLVILIAISELAQYRTLFDKGRIYDPVPHALLRVLQIFKP